MAQARLEVLTSPAGSATRTLAPADAQGRFHARAFAGPGRYVLAVRAEGRASRVVTLQAGAFAQIVLGASGGLRGVVRDAAGALLSGRVRVLAGGLPRSAALKQGRFHFTDLPPGRVEVRALPDRQASGCCPVQAVALIEAGGTTQLELLAPKGQTLRGTLLRADGRPAARAELRVHDAQAGPGVTRSLRADASGRFLVPGLTPGEALLIARLEKESLGPLLIRVPQGHDPDPLELRLAPPARVSFQLRGAQGRPLGGALITLRPDPSGISFGATLSGHSQPSGQALLLVPRGDYRLEVQAPRYVRWEEPLRVSESLARELSLEEAASLSGRVLLADGRPALGALLQLNDGRTQRVGVDARGRFRCEGLRSGVLDVLAQAPGGGSVRRSAQLRAGEAKTLDLRLGPSKGLRGRVLGAEGALPGAEVSLSTETELRTALADAEGRFSFKDLGPGPYRLEARSPGLLPTSAEAVRAGSETALRLEPARVFVGRILDAQGQPVHTATLTTDDRPDPTQAHEGRFSIECGPRAQFLLVRARALHSGGESCRASEGLMPKQVALPTRSGVLEVRLEAGGVARGVVVDSSGKPLGGAAFVYGRALEEELGGPGGEVNLLDMSEGDGSFHVHGVPPEGLSVTVFHPSSAPRVLRLRSTTKTVQLAAGATLSGQVQDARAQPQPGVALLLEGPFRRRTTSDAQGRFLLRGLAAGSYLLKRMDSGATQRVSLSAGGRQELLLSR